MKHLISLQVWSIAEKKPQEGETVIAFLAGGESVLCYLYRVPSGELHWEMKDQRDRDFPKVSDNDFWAQWPIRKEFLQ